MSNDDTLFLHDTIADLRVQIQTLTAERDLYRAALNCEKCNGTTIAWDEWRQILCPDCKEAREKARDNG